jgi:exonuclease SbcD
LLENFPDDKSAYIRLNVEIENMLPSEAYEQANVLMQGKKARLCFINTRRKEQTTENLQTMSLSEFSAESPIDIARKYAEHKEIVFDEQMQEIFNDVLDEIEREAREE